MFRYMLIALLAAIIPMNQVALGDVSARVYLADEQTPFELAEPNTPFVYRDIMVGTKLAIVISSDADGYWSGDLAITDEDRDYGYLSARDFNDVTHDWAGSRLPAAGEKAQVSNWFEPGIRGFSFRGDLRRAEAGDWFIIDYTATGVGHCFVDFYDHNISFFEPAFYLIFSHVPTRDFNGNNVVDFTDFAVFSSYWQFNDCTEPEWCVGADLNKDGFVDMKDLLFFAEYWLESTE